jgi:hypothetical protein
VKNKIVIAAALLLLVAAAVYAAAKGAEYQRQQHAKTLITQSSEALVQAKLQSDLLVTAQQRNYLLVQCKVGEDAYITFYKQLTPAQQKTAPAKPTCVNQFQ